MYFNGINFVDNKDYAFACAKIRVLESKVLTKNDFIRMLDLEEDQIPQMLSEHNYVSVSSETELDNYGEVMNEEWEYVVSLARDMLHDKDLVLAMLMKFDFLNLKILIKDSLRREKAELDDEFEEIKLFDVASTPVEELKELYYEGNYDRFPEYLKDSIKSFENIENLTPSSVDIILDKLMYKELLDYARKSKNEFLVKYYSLIIDVKNILNLYRLKSLDKEYKDYEEIVMSGGNIDIGTLARFYSESLDIVTNRLHYIDFYNHVKEGYEYYTKTNSLSEMERLFDNWIIDFLKVAKMVSFGPEAIIGYYFAKENELKNLRIILTGLENNLDKEMILERLRENYV